MNKTVTKLFLTILYLGICSCATLNEHDKNIAEFIHQMVVKHQFDEITLTQLFNEVEIKPDIIQKISKPAEHLPWYMYARIFLKKPRIEAGVEFWNQHAQTLKVIENKTGVPPQIIVAIVGVETMYGQHTGNYRVIDALTTLAFLYPKRSQFFRSELENFLLLCQKQKINPLLLMGSYAGAMGMPQFMPSSYLKYAIDFNRDNAIDIWQNQDDVIASVGNYFALHGWQKGLSVAAPYCDNCNIYDKKTVNIKANLSFIKSNGTHPNISKPLFSTKKAKFLAFEQKNGEELWAPTDNFYVITRYNNSPLYAMAVYQLSLAILNQRDKKNDKKNHNFSNGGTR